MGRSNEIQIYTANDVKKRPEGTFVLEVTLHPKIVDLPLVNVGTEANPAYIAILDPRIPAIHTHGVAVIASFLEELSISRIITAPSSKSETMILDASVQAGQTAAPLVIIGGSEQRNGKKHLLTKEEVAEKALLKSRKIWIEECRPITLSPEDPSKFFALTEDMLESLILTIQQGERIALVDDVYSSGATINSLKNLIETALTERGIATPTIPIIVIAREAVETSQLFQNRETLLAENQSLNLYASMLIPVLLGIPSQIKDS